MRMGQRGQDNPFRNLRAVDTRGGCEGDGGACVDWRICDVICASREKVYELEVGAGFWARRDGGECDEYGGIFIDFCSGYSDQQLDSQLTIERGKAAAVIQTFRYILLCVPRGIREKQVLECDVNIRMILLDSVENLGGFFEGQDDEQLLCFGVKAAAHCER